MAAWRCTCGSKASCLPPRQRELPAGEAAAAAVRVDPDVKLPGAGASAFLGHGPQTGIPVVFSPALELLPFPWVAVGQVGNLRSDCRSDR